MSIKFGFKSVEISEEMRKVILTLSAEQTIVEIANRVEELNKICNYPDENQVEWIKQCSTVKAITDYAAAHYADVVTHNVWDSCLKDEMPVYAIIKKYSVTLVRVSEKYDDENNEFIFEYSYYEKLIGLKDFVKYAKSKGSDIDPNFANIKTLCNILTGDVANNVGGKFEIAVTSGILQKWGLAKANADKVTSDIAKGGTDAISKNMFTSLCQYVVDGILNIPETDSKGNIKNALKVQKNDAYIIREAFTSRRNGVLKGIKVSRADTVLEDFIKLINELILRHEDKDYTHGYEVEGADKNK